MLLIRRYRGQDVGAVARLIGENFQKFIRRDSTKEGAKGFMDALADLADLRRRFSRSPIFFVATLDREIVGMVRGTPLVLTNLFVKPALHRQGIGRALLHRFEQECIRRGTDVIRLHASLYAVPFYERCGYRKTTGVRTRMGLRTQPMKRRLRTRG